MSRRSIPPGTACKSPRHWLVADWPGLMETACDERYPSGQLRCSAAPLENRVSFPDKTSLHVRSIQSPRGRKRKSRRSIPSGTAWKFRRHWLVVDWPGLMETARDESCPSCQLRGPISPGDNMLSAPDEKSFPNVKTRTPWGRKRRSPGSIPPGRSANPNPTGWLLCHGACAREELSLWPTSRSRRTRRGRGLVSG